MSDPVVHAPETAETPSPHAANGHPSNANEPPHSAAPPPPVAVSAAPESKSQPAVDQPDADNPPDQQRRRAPSLTRGDLIFVAIMLAAIFVLSLVQLYRRYGFDAREIEVLHPAGYRFTLDINTATWVEWLQLDGVGEVLARRIVEYREQHGPFRSIDDLNNVEGIGDATLEKMRPHLRLDPPASDSP